MRKLLCIAVVFSILKVNAQEPTYAESVAQEIVELNTTNSKATQQKPYVVMVSIDGFRHDYAKKFEAKNILAIAQNGSYTERLIPSFPSKTFPNHYSLVTGLYPSNHGIVSNSFFSREKNEVYSIGNRKVVQDGSWYGGVPLWNLAQQQGMCSASYFWVGSEADINGMHPTYHYKYDKNSPYEFRVKRVLEWLQLPKEKRPHFITLYFSLVDTNGHKYGPDAEETQEAVHYVDKQMGALRKGLAQLNLPIYLIVTSDHGMDTVSDLVNVADYTDVDNKQFFGGPVAMIYTKNEAETNAFYDSLLQQTAFKTYKKEAVPNYLNYKNEDRLGDLILITNVPKTIVNLRKGRKKLNRINGMHGYDPYKNKNMGEIFYMEGPKVKESFRIAPVENAHLYPLIAHLLGLKISEPIDGNLESLKPILKTE